MNNSLKIIFLIAGSATLLTLGYFGYTRNLSAKPPIKVGILHSLTGNMAISENAVKDATMMAIDELNAKGGLLDGRTLEPVVVDIRSDWDVAADSAEKLIKNDKVSVVFGCWTSACRKTIKPVFEENDHLLFYPVQYEGLEQSPNIVYTGAAPNQQIIPTVKWAFDNLGKKFFLVGSDYVFPRTANAIIKDQVKGMGGEVLGEEYALLGSKDVKEMVDKIVQTKPDVILNTINGDTNVAFFQELRNRGITPDKTPTISFSIAEDELRSLDISKMVGDYAAWNYFQSIPSEANKAFVAAFKKKYGNERVVSDPIEAAYFGVYLWSQAVNEAGTEQVQKVKEKIKTQSMKAPEGLVYIDPESQHTWKIVRIGKIQSDGQFEIVWDSEKPVRPIPFPSYRTPAKWKTFLQELYKSYGNNWANPGTDKKLESTDTNQKPDH